MRDKLTTLPRSHCQLAIGETGSRDAKGADPDTLVASANAISAP